MTNGKRCGACEQVKPRDEFGTDRSRLDGLMRRCKVCDRERARSYYARTAEQKAAKYKAERARIRARFVEERASALAIYGGRCEWCAATEELELDHVNDDGNEHRLEEAHQTMYRRIANTGARLPDYELRVLCRTCHRGKGWKTRRAAMTR